MDLISALQKEFALSGAEVRVLMYSAPMRYKVHEIIKRNGRGNRVIAQPTAEIKMLQRWAIDNIISHLPVHEAVKAYRKGTGIKQHAEAHASQKYLLKLDFENFFPSITPSDFHQHLNKYYQMDESDAQHLCRLLFWKDRMDGSLKLSIGAPSSPAVSNTILFDFDELVTKFCRENHVIYTRYADDLAFSTSMPNVLNKVFVYIQSLCKDLTYPKITLNATKTVFTSAKNRRQLTGLILTNDGKASIGREKKRQIRAMVNSYSIGSLAEEELPHLRGLLAYAHHIDKAFIDSLIRMIGYDKYKELLHNV